MYVRIGYYMYLVKCFKYKDVFFFVFQVIVLIENFFFMVYVLIEVGIFLSSINFQSVNCVFESVYEVIFKML